MSKKHFISNSDETQNMKYFWPKDFTNKVGISNFEFPQNWRQKISL